MLLLSMLCFSCFDFCCVLLLFLRVLGRGFFGFLVSGAGDYINLTLCVLPELFLLVLTFFLGEIMCCICVFLHVCSPSLTLLAFLFCFLFSRCVFCLLLFGPRKP